jgi:hypothetical protein
MAPSEPFDFMQCTSAVVRTHIAGRMRVLVQSADLQTGSESVRPIDMGIG